MLLKKYDRQNAQVLVNDMSKSQGITEELKVVELPYCDYEQNVFVICIMTNDMKLNVLDVTLDNGNVTFNVCDNDRATRENSQYNLYPVDGLREAIEYARRLQEEDKADPDVSRTRTPDITYIDILPRDIDLYVGLEDEECHRLESVTGPDGEQRFNISVWIHPHYADYYR